MEFASKRLYDNLFAVVVIVFAILKIQTIGTPYFWDELGVYVPGALKMKDNGTICLLPACLEPLYSRGHPLLFVFSQAAWFEFIGDTVTAGHAFSILLGIATLVTFYRVAGDLFRRSTALFASLLLVTQPMFFAMTGVILPEMMLTLFTIPAIWAIIRNRWVVYAVTGSLAMMTKESAIIIPPLAALVVFTDSIRERDILSLKRFMKYFWALFPLLVYALFLLVQKKQNGWYFFPEHMGYLRLNASLFEQGWYIFRELIFTQGKLLTGAGLILSLIFLFRSLGLQKRALAISLAFVLIAILFADLNFYLLRYMLYALPFVVLAGVYGMQQLLERMPLKAGSISFALFLLISGILSVRAMDTGEFKDTSDMAYLQLVRTEQEAISWLEQQPWKDSLIEANFPIGQAIREMRNGYLTVKPFNETGNYVKRAPYGMLFHFKEDEALVWDGRHYEVIRRWRMPYGFISAVKY